MPTTAEYQAIAKGKIRKGGDRPKRVLVYGRNKTGKTTFASTAPDVLIIDPEGGADHLTTHDIWPMTEWADINAAFKYLQAGKHPYKWVAVDGLTRINTMALRFVMDLAEERDLDRTPGMVQQRDYGKAGELMKSALFNFHSLPMGVIYTAQDRMEVPGAFDQEDDDADEASSRFVPDLPKGVRSSVNAIVDVIGRIYTVNVSGVVRGKEVKGRQRRLWIAPTEAYDTGYRSEHKGLPHFIKGPTVEKLITVLDNGPERKATNNG